MKTSPSSPKPLAAQVTGQLTALANRQADLLDSFPLHYRLVPATIKRRIANQFDEFIVKLDPLVARLESTVQKGRVHDRKSISLLRGAIQHADQNVCAAMAETSKLPELADLTLGFENLRLAYRETLHLLDAWLKELDSTETPVSLAA